MRPTRSLAFFVLVVSVLAFRAQPDRRTAAGPMAVPDARVALRAAATAALQGEADAAYAFEPDGTTRRARNAHEDFDVSVDEAGAVALALGRGGEVGLSLIGLGRDDALSRPAVRRVRSEGARVEVERAAGVVEWYANGPLGLEQGFELASRPAGEGALAIEVGVRGASLAAHGDSAIALEARGGGTLLYRDLVVADATGRLLPSRLATRGDALALLVDDRDARYPLHVDPLVVTLEGTLADPAGAGGDAFGSSVAVEGNVAVVGAPEHDHGGAHAGSGAVYVFVRDAASSTWSLLQEILPPDPTNNALFGTSMALEGSLLVVGAPGAKPGILGGTITSGAAYVFEKTGTGSTTWAHSANSPLVGSLASGGFETGGSVAIGGGQIFVGAPSGLGLQGSGIAATAGLVNVFSATSPYAQQNVVIRATDGLSGDRFGQSIAVASDATNTFVVVGAPLDDIQVSNNTETDAGSAYVYVRPTASTNTAWTEAKLVASDAAGGDRFGASVAIVPTHVAVGAPFDDNVNGSNAGSLYLFSNAMGAFSQLQKLLAPGGVGGDELGTSVTLQAGGLGVLLLGGAPGAKVDGGNDPGRIFGFASRGAAYYHVGVIDAPAVSGARLGASMAVDVTTLVVGAPLDDHHGVGEAGTARVFRLPEIRLVKVDLAGTGAGSVTSAPEGIDCGIDCVELWNSGTLVTLDAHPDTGSYFAGWSGACSGTGSCVLTLSGDKAVVATFEPMKDLGATCASPLECLSGNCQASACAPQAVADGGSGGGDAGAGADAGVAGPTPGFAGAGGCGCHVGGTSSGGGAAALLVLGLALALRRRRPYL